MDQTLSGGEGSLVAGAVAIGGVFGILATFLLFPVIDRLLRDRFRMDRNAAMLVLLSASLLVGIGAGVVGFYWLRDRQPPPVEEDPAIRVDGDAAHLSGTSFDGGSLTRKT